MFEQSAGELALATAHVALQPPGRMARVLSAGRLAAQCALYFAASFALTAAVFELAHI